MPQICFSGSEFSTIALRRTVSRLCPNVCDIKGTGQFLNISSLDFGSCDKCTTLKRLCIVFLLLQWQNSELYIYSSISASNCLAHQFLVRPYLMCAHIGISTSLYLYMYIDMYKNIWKSMCGCVCVGGSSL